VDSLVPMLLLIAMRIRFQSILIIVIVMVGSPCIYASQEASYQQLAHLETRRDLGPCLKIIDAIPCAIDAGFECSLFGDAGSSDYVCRREHLKGYAQVDLHLREAGWVSYFKWVSKPPSE